MFVLMCKLTSPWIFVSCVILCKILQIKAQAFVSF